MPAPCVFVFMEPHAACQRVQMHCVTSASTVVIVTSLPTWIWQNVSCCPLCWWFTVWTSRHSDSTGWSKNGANQDLMSSVSVAFNPTKNGYVTTPWTFTCTIMVVRLHLGKSTVVLWHSRAAGSNRYVPMKDVLIARLLNFPVLGVLLGWYGR